MAIPTEQEIGKDTFLPVLRLWRAAFGLGDAFLHLFKIRSGNDRLVNILEDHPVFRIIIVPSLIFEGLGIGLEFDHIAAVFLLGKDLLYRGLENSCPYNCLRKHSLDQDGTDP